MQAGSAVVIPLLPARGFALLLCCAAWPCILDLSCACLCSVLLTWRSGASKAACRAISYAQLGELNDVDVASFTVATPLHEEFALQLAGELLTMRRV